MEKNPHKENSRYPAPTTHNTDRHSRPTQENVNGDPIYYIIQNGKKLNIEQ